MLLAVPASSFREVAGRGELIRSSKTQSVLSLVSKDTFNDVGRTQKIVGVERS